MSCVTLVAPSNERAVASTFSFTVFCMFHCRNGERFSQEFSHVRFRGTSEHVRHADARSIRGSRLPRQRWRRKNSSPLFEFLDECSKMRRHGRREGVVLLLKAFPNCFSAVSQNYCSGKCGSVFDAYLPKDMIKVISHRSF